jgi:hypothetical protein
VYTSESNLKSVTASNCDGVHPCQAKQFQGRTISSSRIQIPDDSFSGLLANVTAARVAGNPFSLPSHQDRQNVLLVPRNEASKGPSWFTIATQMLSTLRSRVSVPSSGHVRALSSSPVRMLGCLCLSEPEHARLCPENHVAICFAVGRN